MQIGLRLDSDVGECVKWVKECLNVEEVSNLSTDLHHRALGMARRKICRFFHVWLMDTTLNAHSTQSMSCPL